MTIKIFLGVMGSGKSYRSQQLVEQGYKKISVADALRETLWSILGWKPQTNEEYDAFKKHELINAANGTKTDGRNALQNIGETFKNLFGRDYWAKQWSNSVRESDSPNIVCDDVRFPEEVEEALYLEHIGYNVEFIFCNYESDRYNPNNNHVSERYAQTLLATNKYNDGDIIDIEDLKTINNTFYE